MPAAAVIGGRYRLDDLVGRGGTAEVWRATDTSLDRVVALKLVTVAHDESSARAADEARTLARLSHPSLVQVYDAGTDSAGRPWVVMEFVDGETLADAIRRGPLPLQRTTEIGLAVAEALDHVHAMGLVHRDVKPANVLMGRGGNIKLTDFGIARLVDAAKVTSTGLMVGTASYLAPEQVAGETVGPATDVYALGLVLLETLTGTREYDGPAVEAAMARLHRPPEIPSTLPAGWVALLTAMTARQAAERPSASEVADLLRRLLAGDLAGATAGNLAGDSATDAMTVLQQRTTVAPQPTQAIPVATAPAAAPATSRRSSWVVAVLFLVVVLGAGGAVLSQQNKPTAREIPQISNDLPAQLGSDLDSFLQQVPK